MEANRTKHKTSFSRTCEVNHPRVYNLTTWPFERELHCLKNTSSCGSQESGVLARAVKEQERREGEKEGFTSSPADSLAFKYYRDVRLQHSPATLVKFQPALSLERSPESETEPKGKHKSMSE